MRSSQILHDVHGKLLLCAAGNETTVYLRAAELMALNSFQKLRKPPRYATGPSFASEICSRCTFFHLWEVVQIFQRESIFCSKVSSRGSLFIEKLVPGGTNFGESIFTVTVSCVLSSCTNVVDKSNC